MIDFSSGAHQSKYTCCQSIDWLTEILLHYYDTSGGGQHRTPSRFWHYHSIWVGLNSTQYRVRTTIRLQTIFSALRVHHQFRNVPFSELDRLSGSVSGPQFWFFCNLKPQNCNGTAVIHQFPVSTARLWPLPLPTPLTLHRFSIRILFFYSFLDFLTLLSPVPVLLSRLPTLFPVSLLLPRLSIVFLHVALTTPPPQLPLLPLPSPLLLPRFNMLVSCCPSLFLSTPTFPCSLTLPPQPTLSLSVAWLFGLFSLRSHFFFTESSTLPLPYPPLFRILL